MMQARRICAAIMLAVGLVACTSADSVSPVAAPRIAYRLAPMFDATGKLDALQVEMTLAGDSSGSTLIRFPSRYANGPDLLKRYSDITVDGGVLAPEGRPGFWTIAAPPGQRLVLRYRVTSGIDHEPGSRDEQPFTPWIRDNWFMVYGQTLWARPSVSPDTLGTFIWDGPADFVFASDLEHFPTTGGRLGGQSGFAGSTLIGGRDIRILRDGAIRVALRGQFDATDAELMKMSSRLIQHQRAMFGVPPGDPYLVNIAEVIAEPGVRGAVGGTGQGDAFSIQMTRTTPKSILVAVFAHETFHSWSLGTVEDGEEWIHEGFTDYYATALALRAELLSPDEFVEVWNDRLTSYALSPARERRNADMRDRWADADSERMQYLRGAIIAALWDKRLRDVSGPKVSLDTITVEQHRRAALDPELGRLASMRDLMAQSGVDVAADIAKHIDGGEPINLPANTFGHCMRVEDDERPVYDLGFDGDATIKAGGIVTGVRSGSAAHAAGLRDGMRLVERTGGLLRNSTQPISWIIEANGNRRTIQWLPAGEGRMTVQRLVRVANTPLDLAACGLD
ncbi:MAG: hypothetical protein EON93_06190 [Burkholderiales bacterium]|nr:MAG: hypothetical protein EON93_06190 [Burkholderiales bacterium]